MICIKKTFIIGFLFLVSSASAHVKLQYPEGGETFLSGSRITLEWQETIGHGPANWDLYFSADGGSTWQEIILDLEHTRSSFNWLVPQEMTSNARIRIVQDNDNGQDYDSSSDNFTITGVSGIEVGTSPTDKSFSVHPAYPNPFNGRTIISFSLKNTSDIEIGIYNLLGKKVKQLTDGTFSAGEHHFQWEPGSLPSGIYYYVIQNAFESETRRLVYIK